MRLVSMPEELKFEMDYKGDKHGYHYNLASASEQDVAHAAAAVSRLTNEKGFLYTGIGMMRIDEFIDGISASSPSEALKSLSTSDLRSAFKESIGELDKLVPAAEAYFFHKLFHKFSAPVLAEPEMFPGKLGVEKTHPRGRIALLAKYKSWVAIKKMSIDPSVRDYEVSGTLCAINETLVKKAFDFSQIDQVALETEAKKLTKGKRKSYATIGEVLESIPHKNQGKLEKAYLIHAILREFKVRPYAHREMLSKQYKEIKPPKPRGRMPKA
ncbi:DUF2666 domain-containing protein [Candidatus Micrarchaeota archaeon]|nr:DUF2666 domain-containing protein [Candidatus Micrarchaeota archaeon]MBD3418417.1 DUF2666 domain-containing protein [Candidatus Micrarchaeota archaeon]